MEKSSDPQSVVRVIQSCQTLEHLVTCYAYADLWYKQNAVASSPTDEIVRALACKEAELKRIYTRGK